MPRAYRRRSALERGARYTAEVLPQRVPEQLTASQRIIIHLFRRNQVDVSPRTILIRFNPAIRNRDYGDDSLELKRTPICLETMRP
jgi:hypothetical protein